jgi:hypothetical protein
MNTKTQYLMLLMALMQQYVAAQTTVTTTATNSSSLTFALSVYHSNPYILEPNHPFLDRVSVFGSSQSPGFCASASYSHPITPRLSAVVGLSAGVYTGQTQILLSPSFRELGRAEDFFVEDLSPNFVYGQLMGGLRYAVLSREKAQIFVQAEALLNYHVRSSHDFQAAELLANGQQILLSDATLTVNEDNRLIVAPQFGVHYQRYFKSMKSGWRVGVSTILSRAITGTGEYQLFGDTETRTGTFSKDFSQIGVEIGYFLNL